MNKKLIIILASAGVAVVMLLIGLFVVVPAVQVGAYKETVGAKQSELNEALNKLSDILERDMFVKTEVEPATVRSDIKVGEDAVTNAESKLASVKGSLTDFAALPLFGYNEDYRTATALKADEQEYIKKSEAFIAEMKAVLAYLKQSNELTDKFTEFGESIAAVDTAETAEQYATIVDDAVKKIQPTADEVKKMNPPASLKAQHDYNVKALDDLIVLCKDLATSVRVGDVDKFMAIGTRGSELVSEMEKKNDDFHADFVRESPLRKLDDTLRALDGEISRKQASL